MFFKLKSLAVLLIVIIGMAATAFAQDYRGRIQGVITDQSAGVLPGATVTLLNDKTGVRNTKQTNADGRYIFEFVEPGEYTVIVELSGYKKTEQKNIVVPIRGDVSVDLAVQVGEVSEVVTVENSPVAVQFNTSGSQMTMENTTIDQLPVRGRNPYNVTTLDPTLNGGEASENRPYHHAFANEIDAGGGTTRANEVQLNGVALTSSYKVAYTPSVEAVQEVTFQRSAVDSEQGFSSGGTISLNMKSGTNQFRGSAYYYKRDPKFNANGDPTLPRIADADETRLRGTNLSIFGGTVGGPIIPKKVFFFTSFEKWKDSRPISVRITVPTALERAGNFSQSVQQCTGSTQCIRTIYDPATSTGTNGIRTAFAGNIIDPSRFDPVALRLLNEMPLPNLPGSILNWQGSKTEEVDYWNLSTRVDYNVTEKLKFFVSYGQFRANLLETNPTEKKLFPFTGSNRYGLSIAADSVYTLNAKTVINLRLNYQKLTDEASVEPALLGRDGVRALFGANNFWESLYTTDQVYYPALDVGTSNRLGRTGREFWQHPQGYGAALRVNTYIGNHSIKYGGQYRVDKGKGARFEPLNFWFRQNLTANQQGSPDLVNSGNEWASFLLGVLEPNGTSTASNNFARRVPVQEMVGKGYAAFFMDDWNFNKRLTLNLGVRWEYEPGPVDPQNRISQQLDLSQPIPEMAATPPVMPTAALNLLAQKGYTHTYNGAWIFASDGNRGVWLRDKTDFLPRLGFALKLDNDSALRVGFARYLQPSSRIRDPLGDFVEQYTGYSTTTFVLGPLNGVPRATLSNPYPTIGTALNPVQQPTEQSLGRYTNLGNNVNLDKYDQKPPINDKISISYQRGIWEKMVFTAEYFWNWGTRLPYTVDINAVDPAYFYENPRTVTNANVTNPFRNYLTPAQFPGPLRNSSTVQLNQLLRPFPQYLAINQTNTDGRKSSVQSMKFQIQRPFVKGLSFTLAYAIHSEKQTQAFDDIALYNRDFTWRRTDAAKHRITNAVTWDLPVGRGRWLFGNAPRALDYIIGGWKFSNISRYYTGRLLNFSQSLIVTGNPRVEKPQIGSCSTCFWFDVTKFSQVPTSDRSVRRTNAYNYPGLTGPSTFQTDATMSKSFRITETIRVEARFELYNVLNNINWDNPNTTFGNANFGKVTAKRAQYVGREVQYGLRLVF